MGILNVKHKMNFIIRLNIHKSQGDKSEGEFMSTTSEEDGPYPRQDLIPMSVRSFPFINSKIFPLTRKDIHGYRMPSKYTTKCL
jgi:hypothetical protein